MTLKEIRFSLLMAESTRVYREELQRLFPTPGFLYEMHLKDLGL